MTHLRGRKQGLSEIFECSAVDNEVGVEIAMQWTDSYSDDQRYRGCESARVEDLAVLASPSSRLRSIASLSELSPCGMTLDTASVLLTSASSCASRLCAKGTSLGREGTLV